MAAETTSDKLFPLTRIYHDKDGESHFDTSYIKMESKGDIGFLSEVLPASGLLFRLTLASYNYTWHTAPCRQFIVNLDADVQITVSTGETRILKKGEVFFVEDIEGKGHCSKSVGDQPRHSLFIPVPKHFSIV